jgi:hypothetical protein
LEKKKYPGGNEKQSNHRPSKSGQETAMGGPKQAVRRRRRADQKNPQSDPLFEILCRSFFYVKNGKRIDVNVLAHN